MKNKIISLIQIIICSISFIYVIGLAGSLDVGRISINEFFGNTWYLILVPVVVFVLQVIKNRKGR